VVLVQRTRVVVAVVVETIALLLVVLAVRVLSFSVISQG
jgi:hypothetical protein